VAAPGRGPHSPAAPNQHTEIWENKKVVQITSSGGSLSSAWVYGDCGTKGLPGNSARFPPTFR